MALSNKKLAQAAMRIRDRLKMLSTSRYSELAGRLETLESSIERLQNFGRRLWLCTSRKWLAAAAEVSRRLADSLSGLVYEIGHIQDTVNRLDAPIPSLSELAAELRQAEKEFGQLNYDRKKQFLSVVTDPLELAGMHLGEFEIRLLLAGEPPQKYQEMYRIVALDPHPAGSDETVTHPHIQDEQLCPGDGAAAIRSSLMAGRICDFFLLVRSVLGQYNPQSAFVTLANWDGVSCYDCGYTTGGGEIYCCAGCDNDFCEECMSYCRHCEESHCRGCLAECMACNDDFCSNCLTRCPDCQRAICQTCLENDQCSCKPEKEDQDESNHTTRAQDDRTESGAEAQLQTS